MTMTLEELRRDVQKMIDDDPLSELSGERRVVATLDAVIRERGELRGRTEKAEAELAALKAKMDGGVIVAMCESGSLHALGVTAADKPKLHALNNCDHVLLVNLDK